MTLHGIKRAVLALIIAVPIDASAMDILGRLSVLYDRTDRNLGATQPSVIGEQLNYEAALTGRGYIFAPGSVDWQGDVQYRRLERSYFEEDTTGFLTFLATVNVLARPTSPYHLQLRAVQELTDFSSGAGDRVTSGSSERRTFAGQASWTGGGRPMYWIGASHMEALEHRLGIPDANRLMWNVDGGTKHATSAYNYQATYRGTFSEGFYPSENYDEHAVRLDAGSRLTRTMQLGISESYVLREPTAVAATSPGIETNIFNAYLNSSPRAGLRQRGDYRYLRGVVTIPGDTSRERTGQRLSFQDDRVLAPTWRLVTGGSASLSQERAGGEETRGAGQTLSSEARWFRSASDGSFEAGAGPLVGVLEPDGAPVEIGYGGTALATATWLFGSSRLAANYNVNYGRNLDGAQGWNIGQSGFVSAEVISARGAKAAARLSASAQRQGSPLFGDSASRTLQLDTSATWRGYVLGLSGSLADGAVGPLNGSQRGDGLIIPFPFNSQTRYVNLTARAPLARGLAALGRLAYTEQTTPEMPTGTEAVASLGADYAIGALSLSVEGRYTEARVSNLSYEEKRVFARLTRSFGTRF